MVTFKEFKRLYQKALDEHQSRIVFDDEMGHNEVPLPVAEHIIEELKSMDAPDSANFGVANISKIPGAQDAFKRVADHVERGIKKEYTMFRQGFEVEALEAQEKVKPVWKTLDLVKERAFLEALIQRAEQATNKCDCIELLTYTDGVNQGLDAVSSFVAKKLRKPVKEKSISSDDLRAAVLDVSGDIVDVKRRLDNCIRQFAHTCTCQKNIK